MDKLASNKASSVMLNLARALEVAELMVLDPEGHEIGLDILEFCAKRATEAARKINEGVKRARTTA